MATIRIAAEALAYLLDLPEGAQIVSVGMTAAGEGPEYRRVLEIGVEAEGWPDGPVDLTYDQDANGVISLVGWTPA